MGDFHIAYILSQRGEPNFECGVEDLPKPENPLEGDELLYFWYWHDIYRTAIVVTCWGYLGYFREGEEDLFKTDFARCIQGRYYLPAQLLQHVDEYVHNVWPALSQGSRAFLMFLDEDDELEFIPSIDGTVSISYYTGSTLIRSYVGVSLENLRDEFYRFGKSLLEGYVFKVRPDLRKHPDFAKLAENLEGLARNC